MDSQLVRRAAAPAAAVLSSYLLLCTLLVAAVALGRDDTGTVVDWVRAGVLLAALGLRAQLRADVEVPFGTVPGTSATVLSLSVVLLGGAWLLGRRAEERDPSPSGRAAAQLGALSGALVAAGLGLAALVARFDPGSFGATDDTALHVSAGSVLVNALVLVGGAFALGRLGARGCVVDWLAERTRGHLVWVWSALQHALLSSVLLALAGAVYLVVTPRHEVAIADEASGSRLGTITAALVLLPNAALSATGLFMGFSSYVSVSELPPRHWLWSLAPLVAALVVGVRRAMATRADAPLLAHALPAGLGAAALWWALGSLLAVRGAGFTTTSLVVGGFLWGAGGLVVGRLAARPVGRVLPSLAARWRAGAPTGGPPPQRLSRRATAALVIAAVGAVTMTAGFQVLQNSVHSPRAVAEAYLDALESGDVTGALDTMRAEPSPLVRPGVLPPGHRISGSRVDDVSRRGDRATVRVTYRVAGETRSSTLVLVADGHRAGLFTRWVVTNGTARVLIPTSEPLLVNGVAVEGAGAELLPGSYDVTVAGKPWLAVRRLVLANDSSSSLALPTLSEEAQTLVRPAVERWLAGCLAQVAELVTPCGASDFSTTPVSGVVWNIGPGGSVSSRYDTSSREVRVTGGLQANVTGKQGERAYRSSVLVPIDGTVDLGATPPVYRP